MPGEHALEQKHLREYIMVTGSTTEGTAVCLWLREGSPNPEIDLMFPVGVIPKGMEQKTLSQYNECKGFYKMVLCIRMINENG